jgi:hypothetical protein
MASDRRTVIIRMAQCPHWERDNGTCTTCATCRGFTMIEDLLTDDPDLIVDCWYSDQAPDYMEMTLLISTEIERARQNAPFPR